MAIFLFTKLVFLITLMVITAQSYEYFTNCENRKNFTRDSIYRVNLDSALSSLASTPDIGYGFYNTSSGRNPDTVNALVLCRGDVSPEACRNCTKFSIDTTRQYCPNQKEAVAWYDYCMLRYSNETILGVLKIIPPVYAWNLDNITKDVDLFNQALTSLFDGLKGAASKGGPSLKYATGNTGGPNSTRIYGLMQCTPDLNELLCYACLDSGIAEIQKCCYGRVGARVLKPSCNLRYELNAFYGETPVIAPPRLLQTTSSSSGKNKATVIVTATAVPVVAVILVALVCNFLRRRKRRHMRYKSREDGESTEEISSVESLQYNFSVIKAATMNFSEANTLGKGGFGSVYKGRLPNGQEIAVKRLSMNSKQGEQEFKTEVLLMAGLQHKNLVRLIGFSFEEKERLLIYEFMPNASLDHIIFDSTKRASLDWNARYKIIEGVAKGLLYLHEDSRLRIIHRDLKASNVLLDEEMNAKIADFGMARLFTQDETQSTSRVVGTYGYMAPEYVMKGKFSVKSDVFSFGVLILEIITGQKNQTFEDYEMERDLLSQVWKSWRAGTTSNIIDPVLRVGSSSLPNVIRIINIGLLCVQQNVAERPTMASVVHMLNSFSVMLHLPLEPAFFINNDNAQPEIVLLDGSSDYDSKASDSSQQRSKLGSSNMSVATISSESSLYPR